MPKTAPRPKKRHSWAARGGARKRRMTATRIRMAVILASAQCRTALGRGATEHPSGSSGEYARTAFVAVPLSPLGFVTAIEAKPGGRGGVATLMRVGATPAVRAA